MLTNHGKPVRVQYYGTREIRAILGIGKTKANELMHLFVERGQAYKVGRLFKVRVNVFNDWLDYECKMEGI